MVNRCLETFLLCIKSKQPTKWHLWLSWEELWYNTSSHSAIGKTQVDFVATVLIDRDEALHPWNSISIGCNKQWISMLILIVMMSPMLRAIWVMLNYVLIANDQLLAASILSCHPIILTPIKLFRAVVRWPTNYNCILSPYLPDFLCFATYMFSETRFWSHYLAPINGSGWTHEVQHFDALVQEWLILWKFQLVKEATWEFATLIQTKFLFLALRTMPIL